MKCFVRSLFAFTLLLTRGWAQAAMPQPAIPARAQVQVVNGVTAESESEIMRLERVLAEALVQGSVISLEDIWADSYFRIASNGGFVSRQMELANLRTGSERFLSVQIKDLQVRLYGGTAIVIGHARTKETTAGKDVDQEQIFTDTWINFQGHWKLVLRHVTAIVR